MRIISSFRDYYDSVQGVAQDRETIWLREPKMVPDTLHGLKDKLYLGSNRVVTIDYVRIGFCGVIYSLVVLDGTVHYEIETIEKWFEENLKKRQFEAFLSDGFFRVDGCYWHGPSKKKLIAWLKNENHKDSVFLDGRKLQPAEFTGTEPIIISSGEMTKKDPKDIWSSIPMMTVNGCLAYYEFFRVVDPYTAFQKLYAWKCNQANPNPVIPEVSDKDMIVAKGFDLKTSFRKEKSKDKGK